MGTSGRTIRFNFRCIFLMIVLCYFIAVLIFETSLFRLSHRLIAITTSCKKTFNVELNQYRLRCKVHIGQENRKNRRNSACVFCSDQACYDAVVRLGCPRFLGITAGTVPDRFLFFRVGTYGYWAVYIKMSSSGKLRKAIKFLHGRVL